MNEPLTRDEAIWLVVREIPRGKVMTYGQVADLVASLDLKTVTARQVGGAMKSAPNDVPWQRVLSASGRSSVDAHVEHAPQQAALEKEGIEFQNGRVKLARFRWNGVELLKMSESELKKLATKVHIHPPLQEV